MSDCPAVTSWQEKAKNLTPNCRVCKNTTIHADAGVFRSIPYLYCRTCKIEVDNWGFEIKPVTTVQDVEEYLAEHPVMKEESVKGQSLGLWDPSKLKRPHESDEMPDDEDEKDDGFGHHFWYP